MTRKSFVVHFSTRAHYRQRGITVNVPAHGGGEETRFFSTETLVETKGCRGFEDPFLGFRV